MNDPLLEDDPWVREKLAERKLKGKVEGLVEGNVDGLRSALLSIIQARFPALNMLAQATAAQARQPDALNVLIVQISAAGDEQVARRFLEGFSAS